MKDSVAVTLADTINVSMAQRSLDQRIQADYVVMAASMLVWVGIFFYLMRLDRKSKELRKS
ncbi:MAG TPA: CcmD family protein [Candidatus Saccharimonadales bacterium]|nr:CcmD family protein [Candidatus Saccharimonadales bacterium]